MNQNPRKPICSQRAAGSRGFAMLFAFMATLLGGQVHAVTIPDTPLQSGRASPAPNMMFILDDSGSMNFVSMPLDHERFDDYNNIDKLGDSFQDKSYLNNTIYYNPAINYKTWLKADATRYTGGEDYASAYNNTALLKDAINLGDVDQYFFVPIPGQASYTANSNYYRYQIINRSDNTSANRLRVRRCTYSSGSWGSCSFTLPSASRTTEADERRNFAIWYSYHSTRMKVAKAGAAEAMSQVGSNIRVGLNTIHNRVDYKIPVNTDEGLFRGSNKIDWYGKLFPATAEDGTPLHAALKRAGEYFSTEAPYGPLFKKNATDTGTYLSCRQNFAILTTDGFWNSLSDASKVGDADGTDGDTITSADGSRTYKYTPVAPYKDNFAATSCGRNCTTATSVGNTLADVAMYYWKRDLRTTADMPNNVAASNEDPAFWQHMTTFGVSIGLKGTLTPNSATLTSLTNGSVRWPDPTNTEDAERIDDLWHASVNGRGKFIVASDTTEFAKGILDAVNTMAARTNSASNVATNSTSFTTDTRVFQAKYISGKWSGELESYGATAAGVADTATWQASRMMPAAASRKLFTWGGTAGATFPTTAQTTALDQSTRVTSPVTGANNVSYIKGDATLEERNGGTLRSRDTVLGDIVNSSPIYVKDTDTLYVGANDGMLHAFSASTGVEQFAYVPGAINLANLATLSDPYYSHKYFVDGPVVVSTRAQTPDKNYLVGALGRGGKGVFGLDVTSPGTFAASNVKWELTTGNNLGNVLGEPVITTLGDADHTKVVIFGNGINSASGKSVLYVVDIATGRVIQQIEAGTTADNGMFAPRGWDDDGDGIVDFVYAGDRAGNLWKFDFTKSGVGEIAYGGNPMFTTKNNQALTAGLGLARDPLTRKRWVFAGTGSFISSADMDTVDVQSMYGLIDDGDTPITLASLAKRSIETTGVSNGSNVRSAEANGPLPSGSKGWYLDLGVPTPGERVVTRGQVRGRVLVFSSIVPSKAGDNPCSAAGTGYINALDAFTGTSTKEPYFTGYGESDSVDPGVGMPTLPTIIDKLIVVGGSDGSLADIQVNPQGGTPKRVSWRELLRRWTW